MNSLTMNMTRICSAVKMSGRKQSSTLTGCQKNALVNLCQGPFPWEKTEDGREGIQKTFHFADFNQAFAFMQRTALLAEKIDHHPEWFNVYNVVEVKLTTHDTGGISSKDIEMARRMDEYASALLPFQIPEEPVEVPLSEVVVEKTSSSK